MNKASWEPWGPVVFRDRELKHLDRRLLDAEDSFLAARDAFMASTHSRPPGIAAPYDVSTFTAYSQASFSFRFEAETVLLFCVVALNALAEAVAELGLLTRKPDRSVGYSALRKACKAGLGNLSDAQKKSFDRIYCALVDPRAVIIAHPSYSIDAGGTLSSSLPGVRMEIVANVPFGYEHLEDDAKLLQAAAARTITIPADASADATGQLLRDLLLKDASVLDDEGRTELHRYIFRYGCHISPADCIEQTRRHIAEVAGAFGADWSAIQQELLTLGLA